MSAEPIRATGELDFEQILRILPHRVPMILVDRVIELAPGSHIVAVKNVTGNELQFAGHFPHVAIMPGVLVIEAAAQAATILYLSGDGSGAPAPPTSRRYLANASMSFRAPVTPGDQMVIEARVLRWLSRCLITKVKVLVDGAVAAQGEITLACGPDEALRQC